MLWYWYIALIVGFGLAFFIVYILSFHPDAFYFAASELIEEKKLKIEKAAIVPIFIASALFAGLIWPYTALLFLLDFLDNHDDNDNDDGHPQLA